MRINTSILVLTFLILPLKLWAVEGTNLIQRVIVKTLKFFITARLPF